MSTQASPKRSKTESISATTRPQKAAPLDSDTASTGNVNIFLFVKDSIGDLTDELLQLFGPETATGSAKERLKRVFATGAVVGSDRVSEVIVDALASQMKLKAARSFKLPVEVDALSPSEQQHLVAQSLMDESPIRRIDPVVEKLQRRTVDAVLNGASWLTSKEVGTRADPNAANKHALASRLLKEGRVFAIERAGRKEFPDYAFDPLGNPLPAVREVLGILEGYSPFRLASWFESRSARLAGRRPREVLATDPDAVIVAARAHLQGPFPRTL